MPLLLVLAVGSLYMGIFSASTANAVQTAPYKINYQGRLTNSSGVPVADGQYNMTFRLFSVASGGSSVWSAVHETTDRVTVTNGQFSVQLGSVAASPLSPALFDEYPLYLEVELPTPATATCSTASCANYSEGPMTPRQPLGSSAYAMNSDTLDGIDGSSYARRDATNTFTANQLVKPSADSSSALVVQNTANEDVFVVDNGLKRVGVGDLTGGGLGATLDVVSLDTGSMPVLRINNQSTGDIATFQNAGVDVAWINSNGLGLMTTSTSAISVQKASGADVVFTVDSSSNRVVIGSASGTDTATTLLVIDSSTADPTTSVSNGSMYYNSSNNKFRCRQGGAWVDCIGSSGGGTKYVTLVPEYAGAVLTPDGTNNTVNVTSESVSGLSSGQGYKHNFYQWDTSSGTAQDYNIVINYQLPSDFTSFVAGSFSVWTYVSSLTNTNATFTMRSATDASCYSSPGSIKPSSATTWQQVNPGNPGNGCTFAANDLITIVITPTVISPSTNKVNIGEIRFGYQ